MNISEILLLGGGGLVVLLSLIEITPIKINPWSALGRFVGRCINAELYKAVKELKACQTQMMEKLEQHIDADARLEADKCRGRILRFNNELLRGVPHTKEDFTETLKDIDDYERYCDCHKNYENGRAVHAIANIERIYDDRLKENDFLR